VRSVMPRPRGTSDGAAESSTRCSRAGVGSFPMSSRGTLATARGVSFAGLRGETPRAFENHRNRTRKRSRHAMSTRRAAKEILATNGLLNGTKTFTRSRYRRALRVFANSRSCWPGRRGTRAFVVHLATGLSLPGVAPMMASYPIGTSGFRGTARIGCDSRRLGALAEGFRIAYEDPRCSFGGTYGSPPRWDWPAPRSTNRGSAAENGGNSANHSGNFQAIQGYSWRWRPRLDAAKALVFRAAWTKGTG